MKIGLEPFIFTMCFEIAKLDRAEWMEKAENVKNNDLFELLDLD